MLAAALLAATATDDDGDALFDAARRESSAERQVELLQRAALTGHAASAKMLGLAYAQGHGGLEPDTVQATRWFREAAIADEREATYNLVALCEARLPCVQGDAPAPAALSWLREAAAQGMEAALATLTQAVDAEAAFQIGRRELGRDDSTARELFRVAAVLGHAAASFNAGHLFAGVDEGASLFYFGRALALSRAPPRQPSVEADATRALWVSLQVADVDRLTETFGAARDADRALAGHRFPAPESAGDAAEEARRAGWQASARHWHAFEAAFAAQPSSQNEAAARPLRLAMSELAALLDDGGGVGEFRRALVLSKLVQGAKMLTHDDDGMRRSLRWHRALVEAPLCAGLWAAAEAEPSCFNDQLVASVTLARRLNASAEAAALVALGNTHGAAATRWSTALQTPRIYHPQLLAQPWWDATTFSVSAALEGAWASGAIATEVSALGIGAGGGFETERIVLSGEQVRAAADDDLRGSGAWSEWKLFDGRRWDELRCAKLPTICAILRAAPEVSGAVGGVTQQGEVTLYKLLPGAHILPHSGVTNRALVLHFPLVGINGVRVRVGDEWRRYEVGRTMVFDDSFEHEVIHGGSRTRYVLFAVLHHPGLGTPSIGGAVKSEL